MAKAPLAGAVKTRLVPPLTPEEATNLHICFLRDMSASIDEVVAGTGNEGVVVYAPLGSEATFDRILPSGFNLLGQRGESLGDRLCNATEDLLRQGYDSLCLINSDSPTLPKALLHSAIEALAHDGDRVVLGAAADGGYYLIGLKNVHPRLFDRIAWSSAEVLAHTVERAAEIGLEVKLLPAWYDVDDAATLNQLCQELFLSSQRDGNYRAPYTREYLAKLIESQRIFPELVAHTSI
jgi:rSAM/selenodomain-associated transferase 1